jgi:hypothetical protein
MQRQFIVIKELPAVGDTYAVSPLEALYCHKNPGVSPPFVAVSSFLQEKIEDVIMSIKSIFFIVLLFYF